TGKRFRSTVRRLRPFPSTATRSWIQPCMLLASRVCLDRTTFWVYSDVAQGGRRVICIHFAPVFAFFVGPRSGGPMKFRFPIVIIDEDYRSENTSGLASARWRRRS